MCAQLTLQEALKERDRRGYSAYSGPKLKGKRAVISIHDKRFPSALKNIPYPPKVLYTIGNVKALEEGLAVIGARRATPYGLACAKEFATRAAEKGICIISGGARGCDAESHTAALDAGGKTVVFLGGGCDELYPSSHYGLFQRVIDSGGIVVSENEWEFPALPYTFRQRNRLIAGLAKATLIVEAGLPSGTFSTADEALAASKEVLVVPGAITSKTSAGANQLLFQGATPVVSAETFDTVLASTFDILREEQASNGGVSMKEDPLLASLRAEPMRIDEILERVPAPKGKGSRHEKLQMRLIELEASGKIKRYPDGRYGPANL